MVHVTYLSLVVFFVLFVAGNEAKAQELKDAMDTLKSDPNLSKVVHIVTEYEPSVSDAFKINELPQVDDTMTVKPTFMYSIVSKPTSTNYQVSPINAAKMKGEPLDRLYKTIVSGGVGNYWTTFANVKTNTLRSSQQSISTEFNHFNSMGNIKVNDEKNPAGFTNEYGRVSGKKFLENKMQVYGDVNAAYKGYHRYGKDTIVDTVYESKAIAKGYSFINLAGGIRTMHMDSGRLNYDLRPSYDMIRCSNKFFEHQVGVLGQVEKNLGDKWVEGNTHVKYYNFSDNGTSLGQTTELGLNPWFGMKHEQITVKAGFRLQNYSGGFEKFRIYPDIAVEYNVVDNIITPYATYNGRSRWSGLTALVGENPYVVNGLSAVPEHYRNVVTVGVKGSLSKSVPYNVNVRYSDVKDMHFFVNELFSTDSVQNTFNLVYDDVQVINFHGELGLTTLEKVKCTLKGDYFSYTMKTLDHPWHKPSVELGLNCRYSLQEKIILSFDAFYTGDREAPSAIDSSVYTLRGFVDVNLGLEYRYTKILSAFIHLNNVAAQNYSYWNFYPVQRFNFLVGLTYALWGE